MHQCGKHFRKALCTSSFLNSCLAICESTNVQRKNPFNITLLCYCFNVWIKHVCFTLTCFLFFSFHYTGYNDSKMKWNKIAVQLREWKQAIYWRLSSRSHHAIKCTSKLSKYKQNKSNALLWKTYSGRCSLLKGVLMMIKTCNITLKTIQYVFYLTFSPIICRTFHREHL